MDQEQLADANLRLALNMVAASSYFLANNTGWVGPQRLFFVIRRAMEYLKKTGSPVAADAYKAFMGVLVRLRSGFKGPQSPSPQIQSKIAS